MYFYLPISSVLAVVFAQRLHDDYDSYDYVRWTGVVTQNIDKNDF